MRVRTRKKEQKCVYVHAFFPGRYSLQGQDQWKFVILKKSWGMEQKSWRRKNVIVAWMVVGISVLSLLPARAQDPFAGAPYMNHFSPPAGFHPSVQAIAQDDFGALYLAVPRGLFHFDGIHWALLPDLPQPAALYSDTANHKIWIGGTGLIASLEANGPVPGPPQILYDNDSVTTDFKTLIPTGDSILFCSREQVISIKPGEPPLILAENREGDFSGFLMHDGKLYINLQNKGLCLFEEGSLTLIPGGADFEKDYFLFSAILPDGTTLFGTDNGFLFHFDGTHATDFIPEDEEYLYNRIMTTGFLLNDTTLALGTRNGGVLILNTRTGKTNNIINYQSGLPDNEVLALSGRNQNILFVGHDFGFSRIDFSLPVRSFNLYPGLEGNILTLLPSDNRLMVGTSEGVFIQEPMRTYEKTKIMVRVPVTVTDTVRTTREREVSSLHKEPAGREMVKQTAEKRGLFRRIFGPKKEDRSQTTEGQSPPSSQQQHPRLKETIQIRKRTIYRYVPKEIKKFKSLTYRFVKVENLNASCQALVRAEGRVLAATNAGLYEIRNNRAEFIFLGTQVHNITADPQKKNQWFCGTDNGIYLLSLDEDKWSVNREWYKSNTPVFSLARSDSGLWAGLESRAVWIGLSGSNTITNTRTYRFPVTFSQQVTVWLKEEHPGFIMTEGWYEYHPDLDKMILRTDYPGAGMQAIHFFPAGKNIWIETPQGWLGADGLPREKSRYLNIVDDISGIYEDPGDHLWVISGHHSIYRITNQEGKVPPFHAGLSELVQSRSRETDNFWYHLLRPSGEIRLILTAPWFVRPDKTVYQYRIEGFTGAWSAWQQAPLIQIPLLPPGNYRILYRARNITGTIADGPPLPIIIPKPFWQKWWFVFLVIIILVLIIRSFIKYRVRKLEKERRILEEKVRERTSEIRKQKEIIEQHLEEIGRQKKAITDSIRYAQKIQKALLPPEHMVQKYLPEHFILFRPRDIVSGDFYWVRRKGQRIIVAAADCTGHGVPGAFMSMLGASFMNEIYNRNPGLPASDILNQLRTMVKESLHQTGRTYETKDGMDMALAVIDMKKGQIDFAGAYNPLILVRDGKIVEYKADKMPIGIHIREDIPFTSTLVTLQENDMIYLFSDGYMDQFGEQKQKKFKSSRFKELLIQIAPRDVIEQKEILEKTFLQWKGNLEQIDDVLVVGIRYRKE